MIRIPNRRVRKLIIYVRIFFVSLFSESEVKDVCLSVCSNSCVTPQNGNEDATAAVQNKASGKAQPNQRPSSNQNNRYHRPPPVVTDEEYSDSSGGLYNDYVSNSSVSVIINIDTIMGLGQKHLLSVQGRSKA